MIEDVAALVLTDPDAGAVALTLERYDRLVPTRSWESSHISAEDVGQLKAAFSRSGYNAWIPSVDVLDPKEVAFVVLADGNRHRRDRRGGRDRFGPLPAPAGRHTIERRRLGPAPISSAADFHTGASP